MCVALHLFGCFPLRMKCSSSVALRAFHDGRVGATCYTRCQRVGIDNPFTSKPYTHLRNVTTLAAFREPTPQARRSLRGPRRPDYRLRSSTDVKWHKLLCLYRSSFSRCHSSPEPHPFHPRDTPPWPSDHVHRPLKPHHVFRVPSTSPPKRTEENRFQKFQTS